MKAQGTSVCNNVNTQHLKDKLVCMSLESVSMFNKCYMMCFY